MTKAQKRKLIYELLVLTKDKQTKAKKQKIYISYKDYKEINEKL